MSLSKNITQTGIKVAFIDNDGKKVGGITVDQANEISQNNPDTKFYFQNGDGLEEELSIDQVNQLTTANLLPTAPACPTGPQVCGPPLVRFFGGGGIGASANAIISPISSSIIGFDIIDNGFGFFDSPSAELIDPCGKGSGSKLQVNLEDDEEDTANLEGTGTGIGGAGTGIGGAGTGIGGAGTGIGGAGTGTGGTGTGIGGAGTGIGGAGTGIGGAGGSLGGTPVTAGGTGGTPLSFNGTPVTVGGTGGTGTGTGGSGTGTGGSLGGTPVTAGGTGGTPLSFNGTPVTVGGTGGSGTGTGGSLGGTPVTAGGTGGTPLSFNGTPVTVGGTGRTPVTVGGTGGTPLIVNGTPLIVDGTVAIVGGTGGRPVTAGRTPVTAGGTGGTPLTVGGTGGTPLTTGQSLVPTTETQCEAPRRSFEESTLRRLGRSKKIKNITIIAPGDGYLATPDGSLGGNEKVWKEPDEAFVQTKCGGYYVVQPYRPIKVEAGDTYYPPDGPPRTLTEPEVITLPLVPVTPPSPENIGLTYPVVLIIDEIKVLDPGFGYRPGDQLIISPSNGAVTDLVINERGEVERVDLIQSGIGFLDLPNLSTNSPTGFNATFSTIFKPIRIDINKPIEDQIREFIENKIIPNSPISPSAGVPGVPTGPTGTGIFPVPPTVTGVPTGPTGSGVPTDTTGPTGTGVPTGTTGSARPRPDFQIIPEQIQLISVIDCVGKIPPKTEFFRVPR